MFMIVDPTAWTSYIGGVVAEMKLESSRPSVLSIEDTSARSLDLPIERDADGSNWIGAIAEIDIRQADGSHASTSG